MNFDDPLRDQIEQLDLQNPHNGPLIRQVLEYWASLKDTGINNQLLQELVLKYSASEKKLKQLNEELLDKQKRLDADLAAAAEIQKSLLPHKIDSTANLSIAWKFMPCEHTGGDIFNLFQLDDDHWALYMLDVSGHGVQAAMVTVSVAQFLQPNSGQLLKRSSKGAAATSQIRTPAEVLTALDDEFPFERFNNFFTITYMTINTRTGDLRYSNAGHPHSILIHPNGQLELLPKGGPAIGMGDFHLLSGQVVRFEEGRLQLDPGDQLFVYTDGIIEYQKPGGGLYGTERFCETLQALQGRSISEMIALSIEALLNFGDHTKPQDDITMLGLELKGTDPES
ncbi:MAG: serine/threonine-protein phosphatase [Deltaproteobacteria bacterium]|jgi:sigma-B regulation protein RsbU (phosphoserine phosphatase)|nr:serine/threonine-protein phosphatase [Deltaproteobacteria bacterium]MBW2467878.1 serine/threonine-protein phosphatase [Deltaproteobacteria bacterium]MBW2516879.1 serine/threonine-protein phosphatase [Deltaproteobacteria bacterium]